MKYPEKEVSLPTIYMLACGATQAAAEAYFPPITFNESNSEKSTENSAAFKISQNGTAFLTAEKGFALLVGINNYGNDHNLKGCINDVTDVKNFLIYHGWNVNRIKVLVDKQATKDRVLAELRWLVSHCKKTDSLVFHFSGHGGWTLTKDGSGWECCICCANCSQNWDDGVITRAQFNTAIERPGGNLQVTLDSCFSGGMTSTYSAWKEIPAEAKEVLYGKQCKERLSHGIRALPGPEWVTVTSACERLKLTPQELLHRIKDRTLESREVLNGPLHVRV